MNNPLGWVAAVFAALEFITRAFNPKLRKETKKSKVAFGVFYVGFLLLGVGAIIWVAWSFLSQHLPW